MFQLKEVRSTKLENGEMSSKTVIKGYVSCGGVLEAAIFLFKVKKRDFSVQSFS